MKITKRVDGSGAGTVILNKLVGREWEITIVWVNGSHRGKGVASDLLERAKAHALKNDLMLVGYIGPDGDGGLDYDQIKAWLVRHGFKHGWYDFTQAQKRAWHDGKTFNKRVLIFNE